MLFSFSAYSQTARTAPAVIEQFQSVKEGDHVRLRFADGKEVKGKVIAKGASNFQLRVNRAFKKAQPTTFDYSSTTEVKKIMPPWVVPTVIVTAVSVAAVTTIGIIGSGI
jgi:hypothetical protein